MDGGTQRCTGYLFWCGVAPCAISSGPLRTARTAARAADRPDHFGRLRLATLQYTVTVHTRRMGHNGYMRGVCTVGEIYINISCRFFLFPLSISLSFDLGHFHWINIKVYANWTKAKCYKDRQPPFVVWLCPSPNPISVA